MDETIIFGRETDREEMISLLTSDYSSSSSAENSKWVIPIYGMGGLGKTTLAKLVYNDERIDKHIEQYPMESLSPLPNFSMSAKPFVDDQEDGMNFQDDPVDDKEELGDQSDQDELVAQPSEDFYTDDENLEEDEKNEDYNDYEEEEDADDPNNKEYTNEKDTLDDDNQPSDETDNNKDSTENPIAPNGEGGNASSDAKEPATEQTDGPLDALKDTKQQMEETQKMTSDEYKDTKQQAEETQKMASDNYKDTRQQMEETATVTRKRVLVQQQYQRKPQELGQQESQELQWGQPSQDQDEYEDTKQQAKPEVYDQDEMNDQKELDDQLDEDCDDILDRDEEDEDYNEDGEEDADYPNNKEYTNGKGTLDDDNQASDETDNERDSRENPIAPNSEGDNASSDAKEPAKQTDGPPDALKDAKQQWEDDQKTASDTFMETRQQMASDEYKDTKLQAEETDQKMASDGIKDTKQQAEEAQKMASDTYKDTKQQAEETQKMASDKYKDTKQQMEKTDQKMVSDAFKDANEVMGTTNNMNNNATAVRRRPRQKAQELGQHQQMPRGLEQLLQQYQGKPKEWLQPQSQGTQEVDILEGIRKIVEQKDLHSIYQFGGVEGIAKALETDVEKGIHGNEDDITTRKMKFGSNGYKRPPTRSFFSFALKAFEDHKMLFLLIYPVLTMAFGINNHGLKERLYDGGIIFCAISLVAVIKALGDFCAYRESLMLSYMSSDINVEVMRGGLHQNMSAINVVVGDLVFLKTGDRIPANGLFLRGHSLQVSESSMTEECHNVNVKYPFLFSGAKVVDGFAHMLVISVGMNMPLGKMVNSSRYNLDQKTPLQVKLVRLTSHIRWIVLKISLLILVVSLVRYWMQSKELNGNKKNRKEVMKSILRIFTAAVTIRVMVIPEGWHIIVTLTSAYLRRTKMSDCALFRNISALETMGTITTICTEKTGMLTSHEMKVTKFCIGEEVLTRDISIIAPETLSLLHQAVGLNSTSSVLSSTSQLQFFGNPSERAMLHWATSELGMSMENLKQFYTVLHVEPFNANKLRSGVLLREKNGANSFDHVHWKGPAEMILPMCSHYYTTYGTSKFINQQTRRRFEETIQGMAAHPLRCIAFAHKRTKGEQPIDERGFTLLVLVCLKETCQPGVGKAVEDCRFAGVDVKMITGDNIFTAKAIATECGILRANQDFLGTVVGGQEFSNYPNEQRMEMVDQIRVMAGSSPSAKFLMVECLKKRGHIVATTGGDATDAPTLKESHVGLSMKIQGTEEAKESSGVVILNDNFTSTAPMLQCGRCIYNNTRNFLQFQLTLIIVTLVVNCVTAVFTYKISISPIQVLWESLIVDTLGALALAREHPTKELMVKGPVSPEEPLITKIMWRNLVSQALFQIVLLLLLQFKGQSIFQVDESVNDTLIFNTSILCQLFNLFNSRNLEKKNVFEGIQDNRLFLWIVGIIVSMQVLMVELLNRFAGTERLDRRLWADSVGMAAMSWLIAFIVKCLPMHDGIKALKHLFFILNSFMTRRKELPYQLVDMV